MDELWRWRPTFRTIREARGIGVVDVRGRVVTPGLVDLHVHFREPGQTSKENIESGALCAARGGFTSVVCMPNTRPAIDDPAAVGLVKDRAQGLACVRVFVAGAITKDIAGEELAPIGSLHRAGVVAITDDGKCIQNTELMRRALEYARMYELKVMDHCQDYDLVAEGVMHEGYWSTALGLRGWPAVGEDSIVARNVILAWLTGTHIHCQHISSRRSVDLIRQARAEGVPISGEACPHHYVLTDAAVAGSEAFWNEDGRSLYAAQLMPEGQRPVWPAYDTNFKMNPRCARRMIGRRWWKDCGTARWIFWRAIMRRTATTRRTWSLILRRSAFWDSRRSWRWR